MRVVVSDLLFGLCSLGGVCLCCPCAFYSAGVVSTQEPVAKRCRQACASDAVAIAASLALLRETKNKLEVAVYARAPTTEVKRVVGGAERLESELRELDCWAQRCTVAVVSASGNRLHATFWDRAASTVCGWIWTGRGVAVPVPAFDPS
eukprot:3216386-Amphidinium_carterae.1